MGARDPNSGLHVYTAGTLLTGPQTKPSAVPLNTSEHIQASKKGFILLI